MPQAIQWQPQDDEGWTPVIGTFELGFPPTDMVVEFHSIWSISPFFLKWSDLNPSFNIAGLYWRPV